MRRPTIYVVDDDAAVLKAVSRLVRFAGHSVQTCNSSQEFLERFKPDAGGCIILDVAMPGLDGLQLQQELQARGVDLPIIFLSGHGDIPMSVQAIKRGAIDFLTKPVQKATLLSAINAALAHRDACRNEAVVRESIRQRLASLTPREREVMEHVVRGKLNKQIAAELGTVEQTIKVHRSRVMHKMRAESLAELVRIADQVGLAAM